MPKSKENSDSHIDKLKALDTKLSKLKGSGGFINKRKNIGVEKASTGCITLDRLLEGGFPKGRVVEILGNPSSGKTTLSLHLISALQKQGMSCLFVDVEATYTDDYAKACGVDTSTLGYFCPDSMEDAIEAIKYAGEVIDFIFIDSVPAMIPTVELEKDAGSATLAIRARILSQEIPKLISIAKKSNCTFVFLNQYRTANIGGYGPSKAGSGGMALPYYTSLRIELTKIATLTEGSEQIGHTSRIKIIKSKISAPFQEDTIDIIYPNTSYAKTSGAGIDRVGDIINVGKECGIIQLKGSFYSYGDNVKVQGKNQLREYLNSNPDVLEQIGKDIKSYKPVTVE